MTRADHLASTVQLTNAHPARDLVVPALAL